MKHALSSTKGFTLIETLVAVAILAYSVTAIVVVTGFGVFNANYLENKMTAQYLAQEGFEIVRSIRDTEMVQQAGSGGSAIESTPLLAECLDNWCTLDTFSLEVPAEDCEGNFSDPEQPEETVICPTLATSSTLGGYDYSSDTPTIFEREIAVVKNGDNGSFTVYSRVVWGGGRGKVSYVGHLYDWFGQAQ